MTQKSHMTIQYEIRDTAGLCVLHSTSPGCTSLMLLFAWNMTLLHALQSHSPDLHGVHWKLLQILQPVCMEAAAGLNAPRNCIREPLLHSAKGSMRGLGEPRNTVQAL